MRNVHRLGILGSITFVGSVASIGVARADDVICGASAQSWSAPRGAIVVDLAKGDGMITKVIEAIGEHYSHSMFSHGPNTVSHATRVTKAPDTSANCKSPLDSYQLQHGGPGAERVSVAAAYANTQGTASPQDVTRAQDAWYYEPVEWTAHSIYVAGECGHPRVTDTNGAGTLTRFACDAIASCPNPHASNADPLHVYCDPIPKCSNAPMVLGSIITCDQAVSGCSTGGHIDTTTGQFVCTPVQTTTSCQQWQPTHCPPTYKTPTPEQIDEIDYSYPGGMDAYMRAHGCTLAFCKQLGSYSWDPEQELRNHGITRPPQQRVYFGGGYNQGFRTNTGDGEKVAAFFESLPTTAVTLRGSFDPLNGSPLPAGQTSTYFLYGYDYNFWQYMDSQQVPHGTIDPNQGVVCSTFLSWGQNRATQTTVAAHRYDKAVIGHAAQALFNAVHDQCDSDTSWQPYAWSAWCADLDESVCTAVANQVVNCFAYGDCSNDDPNSAMRVKNGTYDARSVSPDRVAGVGVHAPTKDKNVFPSWDDWKITSDPSQSAWAWSDPHSVIFNADGMVYGCWASPNTTP